MHVCDDAPLFGGLSLRADLLGLPFMSSGAATFVSLWLSCVADYYSIDGELYDCFLYALFVNGAKRPTDWDWALKGLSR